MQKNTLELKSDLMMILNFNIDTKHEEDIEEIMLEIISKEEDEEKIDNENLCIYKDFNNFEIKKTTAMIIILKIFYEYDIIDIREIAENLINNFNYQFDDAVAFLDFDDYTIKYKNLMQNESISEDWDCIELYRLEANTDFTDMCECEDCVNTKTEIKNQDIFIECCEDSLYEYLYQDMNDCFNISAWKRQIYENF